MNFLDFLYFTDKNGNKHSINELDLYDCTLCKCDIVKPNGEGYRLMFLKYTDQDKVIAIPQIITSSRIESALEEAFDDSCNFDQYVDKNSYPKNEDYYYQMANFLAIQMQILFSVKQSLDFYEANLNNIIKNKDVDLYLEDLTVKKLIGLKILYLNKVQMLNQEIETLQKSYNCITLLQDDIEKHFKYFYWEQDGNGNHNIILNPAIRAEEKCTTNLAMLKKCDIKDICINPETYQIVDTFEKNPNITSFYTLSSQESDSEELDRAYENDDIVYSDGYEDESDDEDEDDFEDDNGPKYYC